MMPLMLLQCLICVLLIAVILMQPGRHGGLTESMAAAESLFGAQTNAFMIKTTTILATFFLMTCLALAFFSAKQNKSLMSGRAAAGVTPVAPQAAGLTEEQQPSVPAPETPAPETAPVAPAVDPASATQ